MSAVVSCPACGARNPADIQWCGQCYAKLEPDAPGPEEAPSTSEALGPEDAASASAASASAPQPVAAPSTLDGPAGEPAWTCLVCETVNPIESSVCSACNTAIFESFGGGGAPALDVDPRTTFLRGLLIPGLGHFVVRQGAVGAAIGSLALLSAAFGALLMVSGMFPYGLFLVLLAVGLWLLAALDAYRVAAGAAGEVVLRPKVLTVLVGVVVSVVILAVMAAQGGGGSG